MPLKKNRRSKKLKKTLNGNKNENIIQTNAHQNEMVIENKEGIKNKLILIENDVDQSEGQLYTPQPNIPLCKILANETTVRTPAVTCSKKRISPVSSNFNISNNNIDNTNETTSESVQNIVEVKSLYNCSNNNVNVTKILGDKDSSFKNLNQSTATNIDSDAMFNNPILEGIHIPVAKKPIYDLYNSINSVNITKTLNGHGRSVDHLDQSMSTNIQLDTVSDKSVLENKHESIATKPKYDLSIYDYDEEDSSDELRTINAVTKCKFCSHIAETPMDLLKHKRNTHKVQRKILPLHEIRKYFDYPDRTFCPICKQPIKSRNFRSIFIKHLLVHTTEFYECRICKKKFRRLDHVKVHEKRHVLSYAELRAIQDTVDNNPVELSFLGD